MPYPISWLKDFVDINLPLPELAHLLTMAGMEVEEIHYVGLPMPKGGQQEVAITGMEWDPDKIVVAAILEVMPHPNADRLVLCKLDDGQQEHIVLTGAPNLFEFKGQGPLPKALKVAYAREGAQIYDGHQPGQVLVTLKRAKIRGVDSYSMACSEKELGISEEHEGIILLDDDAPTGMPLVDYMGDAVLDVNILPSFARCASMLGLAREIAAITGKPLKTTDGGRLTTADDHPAMVGDFADIEITNPGLNPRFVLGLIRDVKIGPSSYTIQRRLRLAGMRPINNIVDATNYTMLEIGEPLHAFDYDVLLGRAKGKPVKIITRTASPGETLTTLDDVERKLDESTVLVCDSAGALSMAGVMGGLESEVNGTTRNILLEGAAWNFINIRKTARAQNLFSEASFRFSRGVHPSMAGHGVRRGLELMHRWSGGVVADGLVDNYPLPPEDPTVEIAPIDVKRWLGIELSTAEIADLLRRLEFKVEVQGDTVRATCPDHRLDINTGISGKADLVEEVARVYGYDNIPETRMDDEIPPQRGNPALEKEERIRDLLVVQGLQETISYRFTTPEREALRLRPDTPPVDKPHVRIINPIASDKAVLRQSVLTSLLDIAERNARFRERMAIFEIGPAFLASEEGDLPDELQRLAILLAGPRALPNWQPADTQPMDFYDLKGILAALLDGLHIPDVRYEAAEHPTFHPGKCARIVSGETQVGIFGELHPLVRQNYDWPVTYARTPILAADLNLDTLLAMIPPLYETVPPPAFPPVLEDLAFIVDEAIPAGQVEALIRQTGGRVVSEVRLFDVYRGDQVGAGKKSLAYSLTYQVPDKTLTDKDVAGIRTRIVRRLEQELGASLRG